MPNEMPIHYRFEDIRGRRHFYREAGSPTAPTIVLLHGFPSSSAMFRNLIPLLADRWHVVAPDLLGFGLSDRPAVDEFDYTFDALAEVTGELLHGLGVACYAMYVQDYGAPIGWRLALADPDALTAVISQNGNAYESGFQPDFIAPMRAYWHEQTAATEAAVRQALTEEAVRWQYVTGVPDESEVDPGSWTYDYLLLSRPGQDRIQLSLFLDYASNAELYPRVHAYFRQRQVPLLAVWGRSDPIFAPAGAQAFAEDLPNAQIHLLDGGHFLLESALHEVAALVRGFLEHESGSR